MSRASPRSRRDTGGEFEPRKKIGHGFPRPILYGAGYIRPLPSYFILSRRLPLANGGSLSQQVSDQRQ
jgi:hypothetical protein